MLTINKQNIILQTDDILIRPLRVNDVTDEHVEGLNDIGINQYLASTPSGVWFVDEVSGAGIGQGRESRREVRDGFWGGG